MHTGAPIDSLPTYRDWHRRHQVVPRSEAKQHVSQVHERLCTIKLRRRRAQATLSFYDNTEDDEREHIFSKWTIVRQRLPDILALSETYKPTTVRAQLVLLVSLMNKQTNTLIEMSGKFQGKKRYNTISQIIPNNVVIDISGRSQMVCLKRIPSQQMIYVDIDGLSFTIPIREFIFAISRGFTHDTAARYCPPAISDMLINLSKTKIIDDRRQYKRAQMKMRMGQILYFATFVLMMTMMLALTIGATKSVFRFKALNGTFPYIPV